MDHVIGAVAPLGSIGKDLFHLGVPWQEKVLRALAIYAFLLVAIRVFGRRELGQYTAFDLIILLTLSNVLQNAMIGNDDSLLGGIIGAVVLLSANFVIAYIVFRSRRFERFVVGEPRVVVQDGKVQQKALDAERLTHNDLLAAIHAQGIENIADVRLAISEPNGLITVVPKSGS